MKKKTEMSDVKELSEIIAKLCREYNCYPEYDDELDSVILVDKDTNKFEYL